MSRSEINPSRLVTDGLCSLSQLWESLLYEYPTVGEDNDYAQAYSVPRPPYQHLVAALADPGSTDQHGDESQGADAGGFLWSSGRGDED